MPKAFAAELKGNEVDVLPLVNGIRRFETVINDYQRGWCTYFYDFADVPDVEFFCGGVNEKTPRAAALWRQGNLLHFGFEQSAAEMNETGRALLVNAIVYISRFTEDRPIDVTPSVFGAEKVAIDRRRAGYFLEFGGSAAHRLQWMKEMYSPGALASFSPEDKPAAEAWFKAARPWLHPGPGNRLEVDEEARLLGTPFDAPDFLPKTIEALKDSAKAKIAATLLERYAPDGPGAAAGNAAWEQWWKANGPYAFYSELGGYRWYLDPLAKKRGVPSKQLRGPLRADVAKQN
jgi:hypothetical protein